MTDTVIVAHSGGPYPSDIPSDPAITTRPDRKPSTRPDRWPVHVVTSIHDGRIWTRCDMSLPVDRGWVTDPTDDMTTITCPRCNKRIVTT